jgi:hypothetical protein
MRMMNASRFLLGIFALALLLPGQEGGSAAATDRDNLSARIALKFDAAEAEAVLAILERIDAKLPVDEGLWQRLFVCEPYVRLKKREAEIARMFNEPSLIFSDDDFKKFVLSPELASRTQALRSTLKAWAGADLQGEAKRILEYLPQGARIAVKIYPVIKPGVNSFVYELSTDPAIFLYLDPEKAEPEFANTVAHELHHIGFASIEAGLEKQYEGLPEATRTAVKWLSAFGEGFAMLAAAGGADVHPHATSRASDRSRWDQDMTHFNRDLGDVEKFFLDIVAGRLKTEAQIDEKGSSFFGIQGPWYTVGYKMAAMVEKQLGRAELIACMKDLRLLLLDYNKLAAEAKRRGESELALWSPELIKALGLN